MKYKVTAKAQLKADFFIEDEQLISYFGQEKFETTEKEILLKQIIQETESVRDWTETELNLEITNIDNNHNID